MGSLGWATAIRSRRAKTPGWRSTGTPSPTASVRAASSGSLPGASQTAVPAKPSISQAVPQLTATWAKALTNFGKCSMYWLDCGNSQRATGSSAKASTRVPTQRSCSPRRTEAMVR